MNILIFLAGAASGVGLMIVLLRCMRDAAEKARREQKKELAHIQSEREAAYDRGYDRAVRDCKRLSSRSAAEQFADTFEDRRVKFQMREAQ